ncbi:MAG: hypothetical protein J6X28_03555 [Bacilli bacterium]|nr:hypothetical protein [Bacilli bacterium]
MTLEDEYRILIGGYYGISYLDEYPLKEFLLKDIEKYIQDYLEENPLEGFDFQRESEILKESLPPKRKLQDAYLLMNRMKGPMDVVFLIQKKLKEMDSK